MSCTCFVCLRGRAHKNPPVKAKAQSVSVDALITEWESDPEVKDAIAKGRKWLKAVLVDPTPDARFDDVYEDGLAWLNTL